VFDLVKSVGGFSNDDLKLFKKYILKVGAAKKYKDYERTKKMFNLKFI
jgi:hypothetical protein